MRPQQTILLAALSALALLSVAGATSSVSSLPGFGESKKEIAEFAVTTHNQWVPIHQLRLVSVDRFESTELIPNVSVIYKLLLTTADTVGIAKQRYEAVVKVASLKSGPSYKQLLSFLPKTV